MKDRQVKAAKCSLPTLLALATLATLPPSSADAAVVYRGVADLTAEADQIVIGDVIEVRSSWDDNGELIQSRVTVRVVDYLYGGGPGLEMLRMNGGTVDGMSLVVSVLPTFQEGDHVLLFLGSSEIRLVQSFQGAYLTDGETVARMAPGCGAGGVIEETVQPLSDFLAEIQHSLPDGVTLPPVTPYGGDFVLPLGGERFGLCGYDWTYMADPMGENYLVNANCADGGCGSGASQITQFQTAMDNWNTQGGARFEFTYGGTTTQTAVAFNSTNILYFDTTPPDGGDYVAANYHWVSGSNMTESDIVFNDTLGWWNGSGGCTGYDIQNVATHELGHTLCLVDLYGGGDSQKTMYGFVGTCETFKRSLHSDDIAGIQTIYGAVNDTTPPTPNPSTWALEPLATSATTVVMSATTATDVSTPPVQYYFNAVSGGPGMNDSAWQASTTYADFDLQPNTTYWYRVKSRDSFVPSNEGIYSVQRSALTLAAVPAAPALSGATMTTLDLDVDPGANPAGTQFAVQCASTADGTWNGLYVNASGNPTASAVWRTDAEWATTTLLSLTEATEYCFHAKARNSLNVETAFGSQGCGTTESAAAPTVSAVRSCAFHCPTPGCQTDWLCLDMPQQGASLPIEPRQFDAGSGQMLFEIDLSGAPTGTVTVTADCTDGSFHAGAVDTGVGPNQVDASFSPPLPNTECCTLTLSGGATGTIDVRLLFGDVSLNAAVNAGDKNLVGAEIGTYANASPVFWYDADRNGAINSADSNLVRAAIGTSLDPSCP